MIDPDQKATMANGRARRFIGLVCIALLAAILFFNKPNQQPIKTSHTKNTKDPRSRLEYFAWASKSNPQETDTNDQNIIAQERFNYAWEMPGYCFDEHGATQEIALRMESSMIHSFSPYVEQETAKRFVDPPHTNIYYANSPAVKWRNGKMVMVSRIWLERERYEEKQNWPANHFADNWLYTQLYDRTMTPISNASVMGIPMPKQWWVGDGPIEPRLCAVKDKFFITFNAAMAFDVNKYMDWTVMWDYDLNMPIIPKIKGGSPMENATEKNDMPRDKHWMALIQDDELYFVHNLDPLRIMHCELDGFCQFVHNEQNREHFIFEHSVSHLRGGTPFELYQWPYYISIAHSTMYKEENHHRYYSAHIVVLCVRPYRVVYVSNDLKVHQDIYNKIPIVRWKYIDDGFIFPVGLIIENKDTITIGVHVSDHSSVLIRLRGMQSLMAAIIEQDSRKSISHGPPIGYLHKHVHDVMEKTTGRKYVH